MRKRGSFWMALWPALPAAAPKAWCGTQRSVRSRARAWRKKGQCGAAVGRATRALAAMGGGKRAWQLRKEAVRRQRHEAAEAERRRQAEAMASAIVHGTCSGEPQGAAQLPIGARIVIDRTRIRGERVAASRKRARWAAQAAAVAQLRRGEEPDDNGNWAVKRIVEVIRFKGRGRRIDVKVQWEGVDKQGRPWADSWLKMGKLSNDLKKEVWRRLEVEEAPGKAQRGAHAGVAHT